MDLLSKICKKHGLLNTDDISIRVYKNKNGTKLYCKICRREREKKKRDIVRLMKENNQILIDENTKHTCYKHGEISYSDIYIDGYGKTACRICKRKNNLISNKTWIKNNPESYKQSQNKRSIKKYGITLDEYNFILLSQNNCCRICKLPETSKKRTKTGRLSVDHCHKAEKEGIIVVRGLLCSNCNSGIAMMKDDPKILRSATDYLEGNPSIVATPNLKLQAKKNLPKQVG